MSVKKSSFIVSMRCVVRKEVVVTGCTRQQAETSPWEYAEDETETDQEDWEVLSVKENE